MTFVFYHYPFHIPSVFTESPLIKRPKDNTEARFK